MHINVHNMFQALFLQQYLTLSLKWRPRTIPKYTIDISVNSQFHVFFNYNQGRVGFGF